MTHPSDWLRFHSANGRFCLRLYARHIAQLRAICRNAGGVETGGVLVGYYTNSFRTAQVTEVTGPTADSAGGPFRFFRGVKGLRAFLLHLWKKEGHYYLGEWHFHPSAAPILSSTDIAQMKSIASSPSYNCLEPILVIFGGDPEADWELSVHVFLQGDVEQKLFPEKMTASN